MSLVKEIQSIINDAQLSRIEKKAKLNAVSFHGRRNQVEAQKIYSSYMNKFKEFETRKITGKFPRGENRIGKKKQSWLSGLDWNIRKSWIESFRKHLSEVAPNFYFSFNKIEEKFGEKENWRSVSNQIRRFAINESNQIQEQENKIVSFTKETGLSRNYYGKEASIDAVQRNKASNAYRADDMYCVVKNHYIIVKQTVDEDWEFYSKAWHNSHGPKRTITDRYAVFYKNGKIVKTVSFNSFAGNYLVKAIIETLNIKKPVISKRVKSKLGKKFKAVQLNTYSKVTFVKSKLGFDFYKRTFAGVFQGYCIVDAEGNTYHAATMLNCVKGLKAKLNTENQFDNEIIDYNLVRSLNFCEDGILEFCNDNGLDVNDVYTRKELTEIVNKNKELNTSKYLNELKQIAII